MPKVLEHNRENVLFLKSYGQSSEFSTKSEIFFILGAKKFYVPLKRNFTEQF